MPLRDMLTKKIKHWPHFRVGALQGFKILLLSMNPVFTLSSSAASFHQQKSSSTGLQQKYERQGHKKGEGKFYPPGISNDNINPLIEWAYIITGSSGCTEFPFLLNIVVLSKCYSKLLKLKVWKALILRHSRGNEYGFNSRHQLAKNSLFTGFVRCQ